MSTFKTRAEMTSAEEFIQYLEEVESGSLSGNSGVNRSLERLAENGNALLEAVQQARMSFMDGGGTIGFAANALTFSGNIDIHFPSEVGGAKYNRISTASSPISSLTGGQIVYVKLNKTVDGQVIVPSTAATMTAFLAVITGQADRLDYLILARASAAGITLFDGRRIVEGQSLTLDGFVDAQYGQQSELTTVHDNQKEDRKLFLTGGGNLTWDFSTTTFSWDDNLFIEFPSSVGSNRLVAASKVIPNGSALYVTLSRAPGGVSVITSTVAAGGSVPTGDDTFVIAFHKGTDSRLYLWNGQSIGDGESVIMGSVRSGIQWMFRDVGDSTQTTDLTEGGSFPSRSYTVGAGELMVYRNGVKARASDAYWTGGTYPTGSLVGSIVAADQYVEVDEGDGTGTYIIWLADTQAVAEPLYHATNTHVPPFTWPASDDNIEAFIGVMGDGPSPVESLAIYGDVGDALEGAVKLEEGLGIGLTYDPAHNSVIIDASGVGTSVEVDGGGQGPQTGALTLTAGSTWVAIADTTPGEIELDLKSNLVDALDAVESLSATNPLTAFGDFDAMSGFDVVWCDINVSPRKVLTAGGILRSSDGQTYRSNRLTGNFGRVEIATTSLFPAESIVASGWMYIYLTVGNLDGRKPVGVFSSTPPNMAVGVGSGAGYHPDDSAYRFLTSVHMSSSTVDNMRKAGGWVYLVNGGSLLSAAFNSLVPDNVTYTTITLTPGTYLPETWPSLIRVTFDLLVNTANLSAGQVASIAIRQPGGNSARTYYAIRPSNSTHVIFEDVLIPLGPLMTFEILVSTKFDQVSNCYLRSYIEGRQSASDNMGA